MKRWLLIIFAFALFSCRNGSEAYPDFLLDDTVRLEVGGTGVLRFNPLDCQLSYSVDNTGFRVLKDDASDYFKVSVTVMPFKVGDCSPATVEWTSPTRYNIKNVTLRCVKIEGDTVWLWGDGSIGIVLRING